MAEEQPSSAQSSTHVWRSVLGGDLVRSLVSRIRAAGTLVNMDMPSSASVYPLSSHSHTDPSQIEDSASSLHKVKSGPSTTPTSVTFKNKSGVCLQAFWIDYDGKEVPYEKIQPGHHYCQRTFVLHPWIFRDAATNKPLTVSKKTVAFPQHLPESEMIIEQPKVLQWSCESHPRFSQSFKSLVRTILLCCNHRQNHPVKKSPVREKGCDNFGGHLSSLPPELLLNILEKCAPLTYDIEDVL